jgi:Protein of unknown function (DUF2914)
MRLLVTLGVSIFTAWAILVFPSYGQTPGPTITITDATFTDTIQQREPQSRLTVVELKGAPEIKLGFWVKLACHANCPDATTPQQLVLKWSLDAGDGMELQREQPLMMGGASWRTWAWKEHVDAGKWQVELFANDTPVCKVDKTCAFTIEVKP